MKKTYLLIAAVLITVFSASGQNIVRGKITDRETGNGLTGATVTVTGTTTTTYTNKAGGFELTSAGIISHLTISFIGYETQKVKITGNNKFINVEMATGAVNLNSVTVTGYENNRKLLETAGSIGLLTTREIQRGDNMDIMPSLNTIPGVKMEAYVPGDYRISIRGSVISDPWGIRNIKLYWNDIPLSSPDGTASHGVDIDPGMIGSMEVLKGPSGSLYGSGNGGVILFKSDKAGFGQNTLETGFTGGSYGFGRFTATYKTGGENYNLAANIVSQRYNGYRENGWGNKDAVNIFSQFFPSEKRSISILVNHATGSFGIAGGLDSKQVVKDPRQATQYARDNKTSVKKYNYTILGASQTYHFTDKLLNTTSLYGTFQTLDHPYGESIYYNGFLKESTGGYGARTKFVLSSRIGKIKSRFTLGDEYQYQHQFDNTFAITNDIPGTWAETGALTQDLIMVSNSNILFAQAELDLPGRILLTVGASYNKLSYDITDLLRDSAHVNYTGKIDFKAKLSPRIGLVKVINDNLAVHGSISKGYSPPPSWEINNFDGTLNTTIKPEDGVNYEAGFRGSMLKNKLNVDVSVYQMFLTNAIVPVANQYGTTSYRNAGSTNQKGIEATLSYIIVRDNQKTISLLKPWVSITSNRFTFRNYTVESFDYANNTIIKNNYSGNQVTGVVPYSMVAGVDLETRYGVYFNTVYYYYNKTPMNDGNTAYAKAYSLLNGKIGFRKTMNRFGFDVFAGINNALNTQYSSLINLNADATAYGASPAWYNPSPGVNIYGGVKLKFNFTK